MPDDSTGSLPLLRHVIVIDNKSSTYRLGLLRTLVRLAETAPGLVAERTDDYVDIPFGAVGLYWLKQYLPLALHHRLPQRPSGPGGRGRRRTGNGRYTRVDRKPLRHPRGAGAGETVARWLMRGNGCWTGGYAPRLDRLWKRSFSWRHGIRYQGFCWQSRIVGYCSCLASPADPVETESTVRHASFAPTGMFPLSPSRFTSYNVLSTCPTQVTLSC